MRPPLLVAWLLGVWGCAAIPTDPLGTYQRIQGGRLRIGISENPPWTWITPQGPAGVEFQLLSRYAEENRLEIEWSKGAESELVRSLEKGKFDVVIGGFTSDSPWTKRAGATRPYLRRAGPGRILLVRQGENRWLLELDRFLHRQRGEVERILEQADPDASRSL